MLIETKLTHRFTELKRKEPGVRAHTCSLSTRKTEAGTSCEFKASPVYPVYIASAKIAKARETLSQRVRGGERGLCGEGRKEGLQFSAENLPSM